MGPLTNFSHHANIRINERTSLKNKALSVLVDSDAFVHLGKVPGFNKEHLLIFSAVDEAHFILVRDYFTGTILTVLPLEFQWRIPRKITDEDLETAKELAVKAKPKQEAALTPGAERKIIISAHYVSPDDKKFKTKVLVKIPAEKYNFNIQQAVADKEVKSLVMQSVKELELDPFHTVEYSARQGRNKNLTFVSF